MVVQNRECTGLNVRVDAPMQDGHNHAMQNRFLPKLGAKLAFSYSAAEFGNLATFIESI